MPFLLSPLPESLVPLNDIGASYLAPLYTHWLHEDLWLYFAGVCVCVGGWVGGEGSHNSSLKMLLKTCDKNQFL